MRVIELDLSEPWAPDDVGPQKRRFGPVVLLLLVVTLLLSGPWGRAGGAPTLAWQANVLGGFFSLTADAAYTIEQAADPIAPRLTLTARDPADGTPRWTTDLTGPLALSYIYGGEILVSLFPPSPDLPVSTSLIDTRTSEVKRGYPAAAMPLVYLSGETAVSIDQDPDYLEDSAPVDSILTSTGLNRPHLIVGRDLATGVVRWTRRLPAGTSWSLPGTGYGAEGIVAVPAGQDWMITSTAKGQLESWDLRTGAPMSRANVGSLGPQSYVVALDTTVVVYVQSHGRATLTAYDPRSLDRLWRANVPGIYASPFECGQWLCLQTERAVWAVAADGTVMWRTNAARVRPTLRSVRMLVTGFGEQLTLLDPVTGATLPADPRWRVVDQARAGVSVVLARPAADGSADVSVLDSSNGVIVPIGRIRPFSRAAQCLSSVAYLACEDANVLRVWRRR